MLLFFSPASQGFIVCNVLFVYIGLFLRCARLTFFLIFFIVNSLIMHACQTYLLNYGVHAPALKL